MSDLRFNMVAGAVLAAGLGVMGLNQLSHAVFHPHYPEAEKMGMAVDIETAAEATSSGPVAPVIPDWGRVLGDEAALPTLVAKGEKLFGACKACHTPDQGGANGTGPNLWNIVNRPSASVAGFAYSEAMTAYAKPWSYEGIFNFVGAPAAYMKGTKMAYPGLRKPEDRVALIAYLRSLAASPAGLPAPLPEAVEAAAEGSEAAAAPAGAPPAEGAAPATKDGATR
jgi:cytochrome c